MPVFLEEDKRLDEIKRALVYLSIWQTRGAFYLVPDNGLVSSPGFDFGQDNENPGALGFIKDLVLRPTVSLFRLANISKRDGKTRRIPLHKLYQVVRVEDSALTDPQLGFQGESWRLHTETYLSRRQRQSNDIGSIVPSESEITTFVLVAATISPYTPKEKPRALKKHKLI
jgi:hypothetical protein